MDSATRKAKLEELKTNNQNQAMTGIPLRYKGSVRKEIVWRIPLDYLIYNKYNGRIGSDVSYYRDVAILAVLHWLCYTVRDAVDWCFDATTLDGLSKTPTTALCRFVNELDTARRFMFNEYTRQSVLWMQHHKSLPWRYHHGLRWN